MTHSNSKGIVRLNFKMAFFDALNFDYFRPDYEKMEKVVDQAMDQKIGAMKDEEIDAFAEAVISGNEIVYSKEADDFFVAEAM